MIGVGEAVEAAVGDRAYEAGLRSVGHRGTAPTGG
jgi:hypothetical protein